eukprot:13126552-Alexandrium_andersonii.AAC.1
MIFAAFLKAMDSSMLQPSKPSWSGSCFSKRKGIAGSPLASSARVGTGRNGECCKATTHDIDAQTELVT